jgi:hypothetical protein
LLSLKHCAKVKHIQIWFYHDSYRWQTEEVPCYRVPDQSSFDRRKYSSELGD